MLQDVNLKMSEFLIACIRESENDNFCHMCLEELKYYGYDEAAITLIKRWLLDEQMLVLIEG